MRKQFAGPIKIGSLTVLILACQFFYVIGICVYTTSPYIEMLQDLEVII